MHQMEKWHQQRLAKYFKEHYDAYTDSAEFYTDPDINQWSFEIVENGEKIHIILTSNDDRSVSEQRFTK